MSNAVASKRQLHFQNHNSTCFKYNKKGSLHVPAIFLYTSLNIHGHIGERLATSPFWRSVS
jgi:hypothetical protein